MELQFALSARSVYTEPAKEGREREREPKGVRGNFNEIKMIRSTCGVCCSSNGCFIKFKSYKFRDGELPSRP